MITSSKIVQEFKLEYGEAGYDKVVKHFEHITGLMKQFDTINKNLGKSARVSNILNSLEVAVPKSIVTDIRNQREGRKSLEKSINDQNKAVQTLTKNLKLMHEMEAATPYGRFINQWQKLGQVFRRVSDALLSFLVINTLRAALQGFFGGLITTNALLQNLETRLKAVNKGKDGSFAELMEHIVRLTVKTPFLLKDFADAAISLQAFGLSARKNLEPIADWASALGRDLQDVALAFAKVSAGSPRTALLLSTRGINKKEFDEELAKTHDRTQALVNIIDRQFGGMAFKVSKTFDGMVANLRDAWFLLSKQMGMPLFQQMTSDVEKLYYIILALADSAAKGGTAIRVVGESFKFFYNAMKAVLPLVVAVAGGNLLHKLTIGFQGLAVAISRTSVALATVVKGLALPLIGFTLLFDAKIKLLAVNQKLVESEKILSWATSESDKNTRKYLDALESKISVLEELNSGSFGVTLGQLLNATLADPLGNLSLVPGGGSQAASEAVLREIAARQKLVETLKNERETRRALIEMKELERELAIQEFTGVTAQDTFELMTKRVQGREYISGLRDKIRQAMAPFDKKFAGVSAAQRAPMAAENEGFMRYERMKTALASLDRILGFDIDKEGARSFQQAMESLDGVLKAIAEKGLAPDLMNEILNSLAEVPTKTGSAGREYEDLTDRILELEARKQELLNGEAALKAKIVGNEVQIVALGVARANIQNKSAAGAQKTHDLQQNSLNTLKAEVQLLEDKNRLNEMIAASTQNILEAGRGVTAAWNDVLQGGLQRSYEKTGDIEAQHIQIAESAKVLNERYAEVVKQQGIEQKLAAQTAKDIATSGKHKANELLLEKERMQLIEAIAEIQHKLWSGPSLDFFTAFSKGLTKMRIEINSFLDEISTMFFSELSSFGQFALSTLLYGDSEDKADEKIAKYQMNLEKLYADAGRTANQMEAVRRREGETNSEYAARVQLVEEIQAAQTQTYILKTQEMELMEQINQAERERSNIILDRLKGLASSLSDKIIGSLMDRLIYGGFSALGMSAGNNQVGRIVETVPPFGPPAGRVSAGMTVIVSGNTVYGQDDFNGMVDNAVRQISSRRSR
jgi:hypothetical protein